VPVSVLLVEDMHQLRGVVSELLQELGDFRIVHEVGTEAEAKLWLDENRGGWDLAVIDLILEQGTGMGVISQSRKVSPHGRIVVLSDYATPGIRKHCLKLGADAVFQKSTDVPAFADYLATLAANATEPPKSPEADPPAP
jgi:DNA-binding NarL/FixJ family response regulator